MFITQITGCQFSFSGREFILWKFSSRLYSQLQRHKEKRVKNKRQQNRRFQLFPSISSRRKASSQVQNKPVSNPEEKVPLQHPDASQFPGETKLSNILQFRDNHLQDFYLCFFLPLIFVHVTEQQTTFPETTQQTSLLCTTVETSILYQKTYLRQAHKRLVCQRLVQPRGSKLLLQTGKGSFITDHKIQRGGERFLLSPWVLI